MFLMEQIRLRHIMKMAEPRILFCVMCCSGDCDITEFDWSIIRIAFCNILIGQDTIGLVINVTHYPAVCQQ